MALDDHGKTEEAIEIYREVINLNPRDADTYNNLAYALKNTGKYDEALENYHMAIELDHNVRNSYENIRKILLMKECKKADKLRESVRIL